MPTFFYIIYSTTFIDPSNNKYVLGTRKIKNKITLLAPTFLTLNLNIIFRFIEWFLNKNGKLVLFFNPTDKLNFSYFFFLSRLLPHCYVYPSSTGFEINRFKFVRNCLVISIFTEMQVLQFLKKESFRVNFPLVILSDVSFNVKGSAFFCLLSTNLITKISLVNCIIQLILKCKLKYGI